MYIQEENSSRAEKQAILLEAATAIYARQGDVTARELAAATGMNSAALNYYFGSKDGLMMQIEQKLLDVFIEEIRLHSDSRLKTEDKLYDLLLAVNNRLRDNPGLTRHLVEMMIAGNSRVYQLLDQAVGSNSPIFAIFSNVLSEVGITDENEIWHRMIIAVSALAPTMVIGLGNNASAAEFESLRQIEFSEHHIRSLAHMLLANQ
ncbi:MAG: TetR family transcriptional regulator [Clostridiaceae bacterium]|nr:TetR family transcriptional regulator [Clostridiaceae bacterium]